MADSSVILDNRFPKATLSLSDNTVLEGFSFGANVAASGEIVFATGHCGYPESLTDPSYKGQVLVITYPLIGNYGIPDPYEKDKLGLTKNFESPEGKIHVSGVVIQDYCEDPNHWQSVQTFGEWLASQNIPGIFNVDTRKVTLSLRDNGDRLCKLVPEGVEYHAEDFEDPNKRLLVAEVSTPHRQTFGHGGLRILCLDMGIKINTIRCFLKYDVLITIVPYNTDLSKEEYDGLFISNGPGNPALYQETIHNVCWALTQNKPIFGICMGNQILGLAAGASTYKMKYGNRGQNQPVRDHTTGRVYITSQNHGFAVDADNLPDDWEPYFTNSNDGSSEGIRHTSRPFFSCQFHPEARVGPQDTEFLFQKFVDEVKKYKVFSYNEKPVKTVVVLGAGGIVIAQAGEFDYSGSQCLKSLREEGVRTILINPNIATVQTEKGMADEIYYCAVTPENVEMVFRREKPDGILLGWGGQTALNCGLRLHERGILHKYGVRVLGSPVSAINITEDRELFRDALLEINESCARSEAATSVADAVGAAKNIGYPVMIRAAFTLGGQGSGVVNNEQELRYLAEIALAASPQILIEESVRGWKEIEYEVVRDVWGNTITVCNMENFDPMGVHTGESMVVAPSQTLTNDEYHMLRTASIKIIQHLGVIGECNIQYGLHPKSRRYVVIEVNARLSRSSALASKATGYPLAHVAVKLALGKPLHTVRNAVTKTTSACFEPSLDYIVMKVPRWDLGKFNMVSDRLGTMMKSVGEVMAIGRSFEEVIQKALRMIDGSYAGFQAPEHPAGWNFVDDMKYPTPKRIFAIALALYHGYSPQMIHELTSIDLWFLTKLNSITETQKLLQTTYMSDNINSLPASLLRQCKRQGFSDKQIAYNIKSTPEEVRSRRLELNILPSVKQIDTVAGEYPAQANYLYLSYNAAYDDIEFSSEEADKSHVVLGCGVYRIGNSVEFDYSAVLVTRELRKRGHKVLLINHNPETVSTDYDECDRLYFEELTVEVILDILHKEQGCYHGVIVSVGGQIAQNMAMGLKKQGINILGTDADDIDRAEDRNKFSALCDTLKIDQPDWASVTSLSEAHAFAHKVGFPVLVRPSYVLSGSGMAVIWNDGDVDRYLQCASKISGQHPVVVSKYLQNSVEYDVDVVAQNGHILCHAVCEHLEAAGVHSGDATMFLPPQFASRDTVNKLVDVASRIAKALKITGPMNCQLLITPNNEIKVIEANVRSARSVPFVSKVLDTSFPAAMVQAFLAQAEQEILQEKLQKEKESTSTTSASSAVQTIPPPPARIRQPDIMSLPFVACKAAMFSFIRLSGADPILGVEMASTGEVGVMGSDASEALFLAMAAQSFKIPIPGTGCLVDINVPQQAEEMAPFIAQLSKQLKMYATSPAAERLSALGVDVTLVHQPESISQKSNNQKEIKEPNVRTLLKERNIGLTIQLRDKATDFLLRRMKQKDAPSPYWVRRLSIDFNAALITEAAIAKSFCEAYSRFAVSHVEIRPYSEMVLKPLEQVAAASAASAATAGSDNNNNKNATAAAAVSSSDIHIDPVVDKKKTHDEDHLNEASEEDMPSESPYYKTLRKAEF